MAVRSRGAGFQADVSVKGHPRLREQFDAEAAAHKWHDAAVAALKAGKPVPSPRAVTSSHDTIGGLVEMVVRTEWEKKSGSHHSIAYARKFAAFVGPLVHPREALSQARVDEWVSELLDDERGLSGSTVNRYLSPLSKLTKKAYAAGLLDRKADLPWQEEGDARIRYYSDAEEALVVQTLTLWGKPLYADFLLFLVDTGARPWGEARRLPWRDVTAKPRMVTFYDTKNGDSRSVPLTSRAWEAVERQRGGQGDGPWSAVNPDEARRLYDRLRATLPALRDTVWYTARHTFASRLVQRGVDLYRVQKLMGHRSSTMTMRYAKLAPTQLIEAVSVLETQQAPAPAPALPPTITPEVIALAQALIAQGLVTAPPAHVTASQHPINALVGS